MENLTGGTPPVRPLPCVVPCKLYFDTDEITVTMKITDAKQVQYALLAADGTAVPLGGAQPVAKATWTGARLALYARGGTKGDAACIKQLNITF